MNYYNEKKHNVFTLMIAHNVLGNRIRLNNQVPKAGDCANFLMADSFLPDDLRFCNKTTVSKPPTMLTAKAE